MTNKPGQGFRTGLDIQFVAIPFPLSKEHSNALIEQSKAVREARLLAEQSNANKTAAIAKHEQAIGDLDLIIGAIQKVVGTVYTRPEFLPNKA